MIFSDDPCALCGGHPERSFSIGPKSADIVVVLNRKSSAKFQQALEQQLTEVGIDVSQVYFTPVIKCSEYDISLTKTQMKAHAAEFLLPELEQVKPKHILMLGNEALQIVAGKSGITKYKGKFLEPVKELKVDQVSTMGTVSPSSVNRNPSQKPSFVSDLRLFANRVKGLSTGVPDPKYIVGDNNDNLRKIYKILDMTDELYVDIETYAPGGEYYKDTARMVSIAATSVVVTSFGEKKTAVFAIPLWHPQSPWRNKWQELLRIIGKHCVNIRKVVAHNSSFDCKWLIWNGVKLYPTFDTMLAVHLLNENILKGLKPQAMMRLGVEAWGIDTGDLTKYSISEVLHYNVLDTWYMYHIKQQIARELAEQPRLARIFKFLTMPAQRDLIDSELRGAWIDVKRLHERLPIAQQRLIEVEHRIREAAGLPSRDSDEWPHTIKHLKTMDKRIPWEENYNASNFARWMLFEWCKLPVIERGKDKEDGEEGNPGMSEDVLHALKGKHPVIEPMLDRVTKQKHLSSFFNPYMELYDENHRIHTTFKLAGTVTGRLSSGKADADKISGSRGKLRGVNLQQVPRDPFIRGLFGAPPGWTFVEADYSQIELRIAAYLANEQNMKHIYATGGDIHLATAARVTGLPESEVTKEIRKVVGKPVNFGFLYGMGWLKFIDTAFNNYGSVFTEAEAKAARQAYFDLFPGLIPWHAKQRRLVNEYGRVVSPLGRIRHLPDIYSPDKGVHMEAERQAINSPVQGFASDLAVLSMIVINEKLRAKGWDKFAYCLGLVHDAINFEIRDDYVARVIPIIKDTMEDMDIVYRKFGTVVDIPIVADVSVGQHWGDKVELEPAQVYNYDASFKLAKAA